RPAVGEKPALHRAYLRALLVRAATRGVDQPRAHAVLRRAILSHRLRQCASVRPCCGPLIRSGNARGPRLARTTAGVVVFAKSVWSEAARQTSPENSQTPGPAVQGTLH